MMMMMMARLQLSVALIFFFCVFANAALDQQTTDQIRRDVKALEREKQDIAKRFVSTRDFSSKVLDKGLALVEQMEELVEEYNIEEEFPSVAEFVGNLKIFMKDTKDFTSGHFETLVKEYIDKEDQITLQLLKLLED